MDQDNKSEIPRLLKRYPNIAVHINHYAMLTKRSNLMQQYADIYSLQSHATCFGCHSTHHQEY